MMRANGRTDRPGHWPSLLPLMLLTSISMTGCFSYSALEVDPENAASELQVGDKVRITDKDDNRPLIKIDSVSNVELTGQMQKGLFRANEEITVKLDEIEAIILLQPPTLESELPYVVIGAILGLITADIIMDDFGSGFL